MAYDLRERKDKEIIESSDSETDNDSDPDYKPRSNYKPCKSIRINTEAERTTGTDGISIGQKRRGRPPKRQANNGNGEEEGTPMKRTNVGSGSIGVPSAIDKQKDVVHSTVLSWLMDLGEIFECDRIQYIENNTLLKEGIARKNGVLCWCCYNVMSVWELETHAGSTSKLPYENIKVTRTSKSLLSHMISLWDKLEAADISEINNVGLKPGAADDNDDVCQICADGEDSLCCEDCPSSFQPICLEISSIPLGDWLCPYCLRIYCGCGNKDDMLKCRKCEKKYHWTCFLKLQALNLNSDWLNSICGDHCTEIRRKLHSLLGVRHELKEGFSWTLIRRLDPFEIEDKHTRMVCNSKAALAYEMLNECFKTNHDRPSRTNILRSVVYNKHSDSSRMHFKGFYTLILEKKDVVVSAATIRMHQNDLVDMPFIGTRESYRLKGLSRMLFDALGYVLSCIEAKHLVIPALPELVNMWKEKYGFRPIEDAVKQKLFTNNPLIFPFTVRLQKTFPDASASSSRAMNVDANDNNCSKMALPDKDNNCSKVALPDLNLDPPEPEDDELAKPVTCNE